MNLLTPRERAIIGASLGATVLCGILRLVHLPAVVMFITTGLTLAVLAAAVGISTGQLGEKLGPGATGVLQGALGNLPELLVGIFSLRAGLVTVVQSTLVGSILANTLLVLGIAFVAGGLKHGIQRFPKDQPRMIASLMVLSVSAIIVPTLAASLHTAASHHINDLTIVVSLVLLTVFVCSLPCSLQGGQGTSPDELEPPQAGHVAAWPVWLSVTILSLSGLAAGFISDWFVEYLMPAIKILHISQTFTGLIIVAIAGNAVENAAGVAFAMKNQMDYAVSLILNSSLQVALCLVPTLALLSFALGGAHLTLVMPPLLVVGLFLSTFATIAVVYDGESIWLEGAALIGLYIIIACAFWWG